MINPLILKEMDFLGFLNSGLGYSLQSQKNFIFYREKYEVIYENFVFPGKKQPFGNKNDKKCRFCGNSSPKVKFKNEAHVIPECLGNDSLISYEECDGCNHSFGKNYDDALAKYLGPDLTLSAISGKNGVPKFNNKGKNLKFSYSPDEKKFHGCSNLEDQDFLFNEETGNGEIIFHRQAYNPRSVFKGLLKIALSVISMPEFNSVERTLKWLLTDPIKDKINVSLPCWRSCSPDFLKTGAIYLLLLKRKIESIDVPSYSFFIAFGGLSFQLFIPLTLGDSKDGYRNIPYYPTAMELTPGRIIHYNIENFSSNEILKKEKTSRYFSTGGKFTKRKL